MGGISVAEVRADLLACLADAEVGVAVDTMPSHRFLPTLLMHLRQTVLVGAGRRAILQVLDVAAATSLHPGVR
jgi:hypothetical protein